MSDADLTALAAALKAEHPAAYEAVTGRPAWADTVGAEHRRAEQAWKAAIRAQVAA